MNPEYIAALERQLAWTRFHKRWGERVWREAHRSAMEKGGVITSRDIPNLDDLQLAAVGRRHMGNIVDGDCYYLASNIQRLALGAAETLPEVTFDLTLLPSKAGFMVLQEPLELARNIVPSICECGHPRLDHADQMAGVIEGHGGCAACACAKFTWDTGADHLTSDPMWAKVIGWTSDDRPMASVDSKGRPVTGAAEFMFLTDYSKYGNDPETKKLTHPWTGPDGYWPNTYFGVANGETWAEKQEQYEHKVLGPAGETLSHSKPHEVAFTFALLLLLNQRILGARVERADRGQRRRSEAAGRPEHHCKVITLRRYAEGRDGDLPPMGHDVEWSCQWLVRGHWRQQWYPSLAKHQPIWIEPFTKGPEGAPFKDDDARRIFGVVR